MKSVSSFLALQETNYVQTDSPRSRKVGIPFISHSLPQFRYYSRLSPQHETKLNFLTRKPIWQQECRHDSCFRLILPEIATLRRPPRTAIAFNLLNRFRHFAALFPQQSEGKMNRHYLGKHTRMPTGFVLLRVETKFSF